MNKIQIKSNEKVQRKRRTRAVAIPQLAASRISHKETLTMRNPVGQRTTASRWRGARSQNCRLRAGSRG